MKNNRLFVVIVTYNGAFWIEQCLHSVYASSIEAIPIVIDNASTDNTLGIIKEVFPMCEVIETGENLGFGKANNIGIRKAIELGAEYVYLLNQDAWVSPDVFELLIKTHIKHPNYGILSPIQKSGNGLYLDPSFEKNAVSETRCPNFLKDMSSKSFRSEVYETKFVMAAHWLLYVPDLLKVGLFSPAFPHYGEDANLVHRYRYWDYKIGICSNAIAYHDRYYREESPQKKLYKQYIIYITHMNNLLENSIGGHIKSFVLFLVKSIFCVKGVSIKERMFYVCKGLKEGFYAKSYKRLYKKINMYELY